MEQPTKEFVKKIKERNKVVIHRDHTGENEVVEYGSSCFIEGKEVFVKGETANPHSSKRKAMIVLFEKGTNKIIGKFI